MRRLFENKLILFIVIATIVALICIGVFSSLNRDASLAENVGGTISVPAQGAATGIGGWFKGIAGYFGDVETLKSAVDVLKNENVSLQQQINEMEGLSKENEELKRMLDLKEKSTNLSMTAATVVAKDPSDWYSTFTIDKGKKDNIAKNQTVVDSNRNLVGQILEVGENWAKVITILDPQSSIGGLVSRSKEIGIVEGDSELRYKEKCRLGYIARDTDIQNGDFVETSGLGGIFPRGLMIGTIYEIYDENSTMSRAATIEPLADISKIDKVFVITEYREFDLTVREEVEEDDEDDSKDEE